jgi:hypothetical protein
LQESATIYDAFAEKEQRTGKEQIRPQQDGGGDVKARKPQGPKRKFQEKKKVPVVSLEEAIKQVSGEECCL